MRRLNTAWSKLRSSLSRRSSAQTMRPPMPRTPAQEPPLHPFDLRYGVDTGGLIDGNDLRTGHQNDVYNTAYYGMAPSRFLKVVGGWTANSTPDELAQYSFVDLGCGKGRAVMMASEFAFRQVVGVELNPLLARTAKQNVAGWTRAGRALCPIQILCQDATDFAFPDGPCLLYLFNPFAAPVVQRLLGRLETEFASRPGQLDVIYFNPQAGKLLDAHQGFERLWTGTVKMSDEDAAVDHVASPEDLCSVYRWTGYQPSTIPGFTF